jgi:hypothetical protein
MDVLDRDTGILPVHEPLIHQNTPHGQDAHVTIKQTPSEVIRRIWLD